MNKNKKPKNQYIGILIENEDLYKVLTHEKTLILVGIAITIVAAVK